MRRTDALTGPEHAPFYMAGRPCCYIASFELDESDFDCAPHGTPAHHLALSPCLSSNLFSVDIMDRSAQTRRVSASAREIRTGVIAEDRVRDLRCAGLSVERFLVLARAAALELSEAGMFPREPWMLPQGAVGGVAAPEGAQAKLDRIHAAAAPVARFLPDPNARFGNVPGLAALVQVVLATMPDRAKQMADARTLQRERSDADEVLQRK